MHDCIVIGAGPAGMAAATLLAGRGADVVVLDEQAAPGGQIWRGVEAAPPALRAVLGEDYVAGAEVVARFRASGAGYRPGSAVWQVTPEREVWVSHAGRSTSLAARTILLAVGAQERPVPVPGWTLPGAMGAGGVQILLKTSALVPRGLVLAGSGPLLYLLAAQCIAAGSPPAAVLDTARAGDLWPALARLRPGATSYLRKGLMLQGAIRAHGVKWYRAVTGVRLAGAARVEGVRFSSGGQTHEIAADLVALHEGVIPAQHMARSLGCVHRWDEGQRCFSPVLDGWGNSSVAGVLVAGDAGGIGGAQAAAHAARVAAAAVLQQLGRIDDAGRDALAAPDRRALAGHRTARAFLDRRYPPPAGILAAGRRRNRLSLRGGDGRRAARRRGTGLPGPEPGQELHPRRHGPLPGADVRNRGDHRAGRRAGGHARGNRAFPHPPAAQAYYAWRAGGGGAGIGRRDRLMQQGRAQEAGAVGRSDVHRKGVAATTQL